MTFRSQPWYASLEPISRRRIKADVRLHSSAAVKDFYWSEPFFPLLAEIPCLTQSVCFRFVTCQWSSFRIPLIPTICGFHGKMIVFSCALRFRVHLGQEGRSNLPQKGPPWPAACHYLGPLSKADAPSARFLAPVICEEWKSLQAARAGRTLPSPHCPLFSS